MITSVSCPLDKLCYKMFDTPVDREILVLSSYWMLSHCVFESSIGFESRQNFYRDKFSWIKQHVSDYPGAKTTITPKNILVRVRSESFHGHI